MKKPRQTPGFLYGFEYYKKLEHIDDFNETTAAVVFFDFLSPKSYLAIADGVDGVVLG